MKFWGYLRLIAGLVKLHKSSKHHDQKPINVWGCFSRNSVGNLHPVKSILTGTKYLKILIHHMVPSANRLNPEGLVFQQDNDPTHTSNVVKKHLQNKKIEVMSWPAQSPDLIRLIIYGVNSIA